jgi:hypothetical protein
MPVVPVAQNFISIQVQLVPLFNQKCTGTRNVLQLCSEVWSFVFLKLIGQPVNELSPTALGLSHSYMLILKYRFDQILKIR